MRSMRLLDVPHQEEPALPDLAEQDHRDVVDAGPAIGRLGRDLPAERPEDVEIDLVDREPVAGRQAESDRSPWTGQLSEPGGIAGSRAPHPRFEDAVHVVTRQQQRQPGDVILVRVGEDHSIDPTVPRRDTSVQGDEQPIRVRPAVDEEAAATRSLDEDGVSLPDVEDGDPRDLGRSSRDDAAGQPPSRRSEASKAAPMGGPAGGCRLTRLASPVRAGGESDRPSDWSRVRSSVLSGATTSARPGPDRCRGGGRDIEGWLERHAGKWQAGGAIDDSDQDPEDDPSRRGRDRPHDPRHADHHANATRKGDHTGRHGRCNQRHDHEVDERREDRKPPEGDEDDRAGSRPVPRGRRRGSPPASWGVDRARWRGSSRSAGSPTRSTRPSPGMRAGTRHRRSVPGPRRAGASPPSRERPWPDLRGHSLARGGRRPPSALRARPMATRRRRRRRPRSRRRSRPTGDVARAARSWPRRRPPRSRYSNRRSRRRGSRRPS